MFGCLDQSLGSIGASIISGVNGTLVGAGTGISGIINGKQFVRYFQSISGIFSRIRHQLHPVWLSYWGRRCCRRYRQLR